MVILLKKAQKKTNILYEEQSGVITIKNQLCASDESGAIKIQRDENKGSLSGR